jgi:hypothetical protein
MKSMNRTCASAVLMLALSALAPANPAVTKANDPAYNPATVVDMWGTIASVRHAPAGGALAGVHLTVKVKNNSFDVYLGPADFLRIFKTNFPVGEEIEVVGSKIKVDSADVILTREITVGQATMTLRDAAGAPDWTNWGVEVDPSAVQ